MVGDRYQLESDMTGGPQNYGQATGEIDWPAFWSGLWIWLGQVIVVAVFAMYFWILFWIGVDIRNGLWTQPHMEEDIQDAMVRGTLVLQQSQKVAADFASANPTVPPQPTVDTPGPGLFDQPLDWPTFQDRWHNLRPVYSEIVHGWVREYDHLDTDNNNRQLALDYPPMRLLTLSLWMWNVHSNFPLLSAWPTGPIPIYNPTTQKLTFATDNIVQPMLTVNLVAEATSAAAMFCLVWLWVSRGREKDGPDLGWKTRWGDKWLLAPVVVLLFCMLCRRFVTFTPYYAQLPLTPPIDDHVGDPAFWIFLIMGVVSAICLAWFLPHPFRGPTCGLVAATLVWMNPSMLMDAHMWPQWDCWLPTFFLLAALAVSLDLWMIAGLVLGVGCMFKGQILFIAPVLIFSPLLAGWPWKFLKIVGGLAAGVGIVVSPWLLENPAALRVTIALPIAALVLCILSLHDKPVWTRLIEPLNPRRPETPPVSAREQRTQLFLLLIRLGSTLALTMALWIWSATMMHRAMETMLLCLAIYCFAWLMPWRAIPAFIVMVFAAGLWMCGFSMGGSFSWWDIGFAFGTVKWQRMQLGAMSLSNLSSILERRWGWRLHDPVGTLHLPLIFGGPVQLDLRQTVALIFFASVVLCTIGAAIHLRRRDARFLIAISAPWILFLTLLTQMAARYTLLPAVIAAAMVGVGVGMSMLQLLLALLGIAMLGNQYLQAQGGAPLTQSITQYLYPDVAWVMLLIAAVFLYCAVAPGRRRIRPGELA
jgi:hypothetical protein